MSQSARNSHDTRGRKKRDNARGEPETGERGAVFLPRDEPEESVPVIKSWLQQVTENLTTFTFPIFRLLLKARFVSLSALVLLVVFSALAVVYSTHWSRQLFNELKMLQDGRDQYDREWSQLLLEQSAWSTHNRIERVAVEQLDMVMPDMERVGVVR